MNKHSKLDIDQNELWNKFRDGDRVAFDKMIQVYYSDLLKYGIRYIGFDQLELIEDTLQDFFVDLWSTKARLGDAKSLKAYLISSFKRRLIREKEKASRFLKTDNIDAHYDFELELSIEDIIVDDENTTEIKNKLKKLMDKLSKRQKEAVYLKFFEKMDYSQIAEIMDINQHSVINLVYGGIKLLRENWFVVTVAFLSWFVT